MTWEQKLQAMNALEPVGLYMHKPGDWYTRQGRVDLGRDGMLSTISAGGATPEEAVESLWEKMTDLNPCMYVVVGAGSDNRKHVRWNGFMWEEIPREKIKAA